MHSRDLERRSGQIGILSPVGAIVFSGVCWLIFSKLFDTRDVNLLPSLTRQFLSVQLWWLLAGLVGLGLSLAAQASGPDSIRAKRSMIYSMALAVFSAVNIGWGIIAMYLLILPPAGL